MDPKKHSPGAKYKQQKENSFLYRSDAKDSSSAKVMSNKSLLPSSSVAAAVTEAEDLGEWTNTEDDSYFQVMCLNAGIGDSRFCSGKSLC